MIDYAAVMARRHADKQWALNGDDYQGLVMLDDNAKPSKKSLDDAWPSVKNEIETESSANANALQSALDKLTALGLTSAEIKALVGR